MLPTPSPPPAINNDRSTMCFWFNTKLKLVWCFKIFTMIMYPYANTCCWQSCLPFLGKGILHMRYFCGNVTTCFVRCFQVVYQSCRDLQRKATRRRENFASLYPAEASIEELTQPLIGHIQETWNWKPALQINNVTFEAARRCPCSCSKT